MADHSVILGVDIGSVSISLAALNSERDLCRSAYQFHHGNIPKTFRNMMAKFHPDQICGIAATSSTPSMLETGRQYDNRVAVIAAAHHFHHRMGGLLIVGGETFGLIAFDEQGRYRSYRTNSSCATGTGSFLDQQARRLNLEMWCSGISIMSQRCCHSGLTSGSPRKSPYSPE